MDNTENRLIRLEEKLYFQEKMIDDLNEALTLQQKQLDALQRSMAEAVRKLENMVLSLEENRQNPRMEIPRHYQPKPGC